MHVAIQLNDLQRQTETVMGMITAGSKWYNRLPPQPEASSVTAFVVEKNYGIVYIPITHTHLLWTPLLLQDFGTRTSTVPIYLGRGFQFGWAKPLIGSFLSMIENEIYRYYL